MTPDHIGAYQIIEELRRGILTRTYRARASDSDRDVVLKSVFLDRLEDSTYPVRVERKVLVLATLGHPAVVPIDTIWVETGMLYQVSPFLPGGTLEDKLSEGPLPWKEVLDLADQLAAALDAVHDLGISHGDLKPANILIDENGNFLISDFGMRESALAALPQDREALTGPPAYLNPEATLGPTEATPDGDRYGLAVILFEALTGRRPYQAGSPLGYAIQHRHAPIPRFGTGAGQENDGLNRVFQRALAKDPVKRYPSASDLARALRASLSAPLPSTGSSAPTIAVERTPANQMLEAMLVVARPGPDSATAHRPAYRRLLAVGLFLGLSLLLALAIGTIGVGGDFADTLSRLGFPPPMAQVAMPVTGSPTQTITPTLRPTAIPTSPTSRPSPTRLQATRSAPSPATSPTVQLVSDRPLSHTIQYNETLFTVAALYHLDLNDLIGLNELQCNGRLLANQHLALPPPKVPVAPAEHMTVSVENVAQVTLVHTLDCVQEVNAVAFSPDGHTLALARGAGVYLWEVDSWLPLRRLWGHQSTVNALAFSPDGSLLASAADDRTVRVWTTAEGVEVHRLTGHGNRVTGVAFSPDGGILASTGQDQQVRLWGLPEGELRQRSTGYDAYSVDFHPAGEYLAVGYAEFVRLFQFTRGELMMMAELPAEGTVYSLAFSPDGHLLAANTMVWEVPSGKSVYNWRESNDRVAFTPDGQLIWIGGQARSTSNGNQLTVLEPRQDPSPRTAQDYDSISVSPDGRLIAYGTRDGLYIFGRTLPTGADPATDTSIQAYVLAPRDTFYNVAERLGLNLSNLLDINSLSCNNIPFIGQVLRQPTQTDELPPNQVENLEPITTANVPSLTSLHDLDMRCAGDPGLLSFSPDGEYLVSGSAMWDLARDSLLVQEPETLQAAESPAPLRIPAPEMIFLPDGQLLASRVDRSVRLWGVEDGRLRETLTTSPEEIAVVASSPDGRYLIIATAGDQAAIEIWDLETGKLDQTLTGYSAEQILITPDGSTLISWIGDSARIWDLAEGQRPDIISGIESALRLSPDGNLLAYVACADEAAPGCPEKVISVYDLNAREAYRTLIPFNERVQALRFSPDGTLLAAASDYAIRVWEMPDGNVLHERLRGNPNNTEVIEDLIFSPDGSLLVALADRPVVRFWSVHSGTVRTTRSKANVQGLVFSADGRQIAVLANDQVSLWGIEVE